ncbi:3-oxoadipate enol-lactonase [Novosphingobium album (ex Liu et al. 2023)]|uniref:3-oxoadipate enol-lactonase n=1 Tax=Novosphingobium album (ex Liu et al. 2023) TaxID=3031130 RepID=A0ABT5WRU0_9SPHN|nr:3-oxoadipate enol-lactonase [Novosphingobium album (ex Liu et al. 2023)]MDE8652775.1 3-oxoadipate enol-lactonase [Novosphingobium album (ex Liu et al. 2023)]
MDKQHVAMIDGCRIAWSLDGRKNAPVLMLSNSLGTDMGMWAPQMDVWAREFRVLRYDSRGHGGSDSPPGAYAMDRLGRDVVELLDALGLGRVHFCGLSMGGMVGQWLAVHAPERLERLVLANTSAYMGPPSGWQDRIEGVRKNGMVPLADASIARWFTPDFPSRVPGAVEPIRAMLLANDPVGYAGCCAAIRDMDQRPTARLNRTPTLVIAGSEDPSTSVGDGAFLADNARQAELVTLPAAHLSNVECAEAFADAVTAFLG